MTIGQILHSI